MAQIFVSYSRIDSEFAKQLIERLQIAFPYHKFWYDQSLTGGDDWWEEILKAIKASDIFIYILSKESIESRYCQAEFAEAYRLQKRIIPVQARDHTELGAGLGDIQILNMKNGANDGKVLLQLNIAITKQLGLAKRLPPRSKLITRKPSKEEPTTRQLDEPDIYTPELSQPAFEREALRVARISKNWQIIGVVVAVVAIVITLNSSLNGQSQNPATQTALAALISPTISILPTDSLTPTSSVTPTETSTLEIAFIVQTLDAQATSEQANLNAKSTAAAQATEYMIGTQSIFDQTVTATLWTVTPTPNITASIEAYRTQQAVTVTQAWIDSWTETPLPTSTSTYTPTSQPVIASVHVNSSTGLNMRSGPGTNYQIVGSVKNGQQFKVIARMGTSDNYWILIDVGDNTSGWVSGDFVDISIAIAEVPIAATIPAGFDWPTLNQQILPTDEILDRRVLGVFLVNYKSDNNMQLYAIQNNGSQEALPVFGNIAYPIINQSGVIAYINSKDNGVELNLFRSDSMENYILLSTEELRSFNMHLDLKRIAWSPDGLSVYITLTNEQDNSTGIYKVDLNRITGDPISLQYEDAASPAISPDGDFIAYEGVERDGIYVARFGREPLIVTSEQDCGKPFSPVFSYDIEVSLLFLCQRNEGSVGLYNYTGTIQLLAQFEPTAINNMSALPGGIVTFDDGEIIYLLMLDSESGRMIDYRLLFKDPNQNFTSASWYIEY